MDPKNGAYWNTLGAAYYRNAEFNLAVEALTKATQLTNGGSAFDWLFPALASWKSGDKDQARAWYDKAAAWMDENKPPDPALLRYRATVAGVLGIKEPLPMKETPAPKP